MKCTFSLSLSTEHFLGAPRTASKLIVPCRGKLWKFILINRLDWVELAMEISVWGYEHRFVLVIGDRQLDLKFED